MEPTAAPRNLPPCVSGGVERALHRDRTAVDQRRLDRVARRRARDRCPPRGSARRAIRCRPGSTSSRFAAAAISTRFSSSRRERRVADHERHARGIRAVVLRRERAVGGDDANARERQRQHLGDDLREQGRRALADVGGAGEHGDAAVEVELEVDDRVRLAGPVDRLGRAATRSASRPCRGPGRAAASPCRSCQPDACSTQSRHSGRP